MTREIKFRAWCEETKNMHYPIKGQCLLSIDYTVLVLDVATIVDGSHDSDDYTIMQFTGLQDKNGKDIYEGDLVGYEDEDTAPITFEDGSFMWITDRRSGRSAINQDRARRLEVIGNIYENPELLSGGD